MFLANWRWCPPASDGNFGTEAYFVGFRAGSPGSLSSGRPRTGLPDLPRIRHLPLLPERWPSRTDLLCRRLCSRPRLPAPAESVGPGSAAGIGTGGPAQRSARDQRCVRRHARLIFGALVQSEKPTTVTNVQVPPQRIGGQEAREATWQARQIPIQQMRTNASPGTGGTSAPGAARALPRSKSPPLPHPPAPAESPT